MKFSTPKLKCAALVAGLFLITVARPMGHAAGSLSDLDIEYSELQVTLEKILGENKQLREALAETSKTAAGLRKDLVRTSGETEVFKRRSMELKLRMEALGLDLAGGNDIKLQQRLLSAVSDMRAIVQEKQSLSEALVRLSDAAAVYAKSATGAPAEARLALEGEIRNANKALGVGSGSGNVAQSTPATITDAMAVSVVEDISLIVINLGSKQGVKVGMPFRVVRENNVIGHVQVVDVRERIAGAVVQNLNTETEQIKVGDRLVVDARQ